MSYGSSDPQAPLSVRSLANKLDHFVTTRLLLRVRLMFVLPVPLFFMGLYSAFAGDGVAMIGRFSGLALYLVAARLLLEGEKAAQAYAAREVAKPPAFPRKIFAAMLTGVATAITGLFGFEPVLANPATVAAYACAAVFFHLLCFGLDPMRAKGLEGFSELEAQRFLQALEQGQQLLAETLMAAQKLPSFRLQQRVQRSMNEARKVLVAIERNPEDLKRSKKFMMVYLQGAHDATLKLAQLSRKDPQAVAVTGYEQLLDDLERRFKKQQENLLSTDRSDLDVEIEVLRDRIKQEF